MYGAKVTGMETGDAADEAKTVTSHLELPNAGGTKVDIIYTIYPDGRVNCSFNVDATKSGLGNFIRVGSMMTLPEGSEQLSWYGNKTESFNDRKTGGRQGIWESTV
jgi:beta-galactosidase